MNWEDMYAVAIERIRQLNKEVDTLGTILRAYLPIIQEDKNEKR